MKKFIIPIILLIIIIAALTATAMFLGFGISFGFPMELNCEKYDIETCDCIGFTYDDRTECIGFKSNCRQMMDGCRESSLPVNINSN